MGMFLLLQETFAEYAARTAFERPLLTGVAYAPRVVDAQREQFERQHGWTIKTMEREPSPVRDEYAPVMFYQESLTHIKSLDMMSGEVWCWIVIFNCLFSASINLFYSMLYYLVFDWTCNFRIAWYRRIEKIFWGLGLLGKQYWQDLLGCWVRIILVLCWHFLFISPSYHQVLLSKSVLKQRQGKPLYLPWYFDAWCMFREVGFVFQLEIYRANGRPKQHMGGLKPVCMEVVGGVFFIKL